MNKTIYLFTDGSVNTQTKVGVGGYLVCEPSDLESKTKPQVHLREFQNTSSTKLELQTFLWAINSCKFNNQEIIAFSDSQNLIGLDSRKEKLYRNDFKSGSDKPLKNADLYREYFNITEGLNIKLLKLKGHSKTSLKNEFDQLFKLVDRATRKALRDLS